VTIVGGGNTAVEAAIDLSKIAKKVILVHRSQFRADKILTDKLPSIENLEIHLGTTIESIQGEDQVEGVHVKGNKEGFIETNGVLVEIGYVPNTQFLDFDVLNERGEIVINEHHQTAVEGLYAAGDVTTEKYKQIIVAASEGAKAALSINEYMNTL
jgi:alkyl hydroperoxide reductase subunit F